MSFISHYINIILHLDVYLPLLIHQLGGWTYAILFLIIFCESGLFLTPFMPGDSLLFALGSLAARQIFSLQILLYTLIIAAVFGGIINFTLGFLIGHKLFPREKKNLFSNYLERTHLFYEKHGGKTIFFARFIPIIRTYAPFVAGIARMPPKRFLWFNLLSGILWIGLLLSISYAFGNLPIIRKNFSLMVVAIIVISLIPAVIEFFRARLQKQTN